MRMTRVGASVPCLSLDLRGGGGEEGWCVWDGGCGVRGACVVGCGVFASPSAGEALDDPTGGPALFGRSRGVEGRECFGTCWNFDGEERRVGWMERGRRDDAIRTVQTSEHYEQLLV